MENAGKAQVPGGISAPERTSVCASTTRVAFMKCMYEQPARPSSCKRGIKRPPDIPSRPYHITPPAIRVSICTESYAVNFCRNVKVLAEDGLRPRLAQLANQMNTAGVFPLGLQFWRSPGGVAV